MASFLDLLGKHCTLHCPLGDPHSVLQHIKGIEKSCKKEICLILFIPKFTYLFLVTPINNNNALWEILVYRRTSSTNIASQHDLRLFPDLSLVGQLGFSLHNVHSTTLTVYRFSQAPHRISPYNELSFATACVQEREGGSRGPRETAKQRERSHRQVTKGIQGRSACYLALFY